MNPTDALDDLLVDALGDVRAIEPTDAQVAAAVAAVPPDRRRRSRSLRRVVGIGAACLGLATATAFAVPQTREAILDAAGSFADFFGGGGDAPGTRVDPTETTGALNWFLGTDRVTGNVIAQADDLRIVAYRRADTGEPCIEWGLMFAECRIEGDWERLLDDQTVFVRGTMPVAARDGLIPLLGIGADRVASVAVEYADGTATDPVAMRHGFIVFADPVRDPRTLVAYDAAGAELTRVDVSRVQWRFPAGLGP